MPKIRIRKSGVGAIPPAPVPQEPITGDDEGQGSVVPAIVGAAGLGLAGLLARKPSLIGKGLKYANAARQQFMLSGLALPKSVLGNTGAAFIESAERRSMAPLKSFFSRQTLRDARDAYKANVPYPGTPQLPGFTPGRAMNAMDTATQKSFVRSGVFHDPAEVAKKMAAGQTRQMATQASAEKAAQKAVLQAPLPGRLGEALDSETARYLIPFRRTPFNQFLEGLDTVKIENIKKNPQLFALLTGAGAAHGAATAEDRYPVTLGLGTALAGRYALPYSLAALAGRHYLGGGRTDAGIGGAILPVSEYGITSGVEDPLQAFTNPAALTALRRIMGED